MPRPPVPRPAPARPRRSTAARRPQRGTAGGAPPQSAAARSKYPDYQEWERLADRAEADLVNPDTTTVALEHTRALLVDWREALYGAENFNATRITTVQTQIDALGPVPAEGAAEAPEIAKRRAQLGDQLVRLKAPSLEAEEAYQRAVGLIGEIDRVLRERQADALMQLWPSPLNPANWPEAFGALKKTGAVIAGETRQRWKSPAARQQLADRLPVVVILVLLAVAILWRGRRFIDRLTLRMQNSASGSGARGRRILAFLASLGQVAVPVAGLMLLARALVASGMTGIVGTVVLQGLPAVGFIFFAAVWLGGRLFPVGQHAEAALRMSREERAEGRFLAGVLGFLVAVEGLRRLAMDQMGLSEAALSVLSYPVVLLTGLFLFRLGQLMRGHALAELQGDAPRGFANRVVGFIGRAAMVIGVVGPLLGAFGYVTAAAELVFSATMTFALAGLLSVLDRLVGSTYALVTRQDDAEADTALLPVLITLAMVLAAVPLLALIWGARSSDLADLWTSLRNGISIGSTRLSPSAIVVFLLVFGAGYAMTRLLKEVLRVSILPRTRLDHGGQNAILSGVGYVGIFLAGIIGIKSAGIDLSGFAMVASALSLGIGFGMQTVVSNFVSGVILLIERPISEGDWIEVGPVQGIVQTISVRSTRIQTFDRTDVIVPNSDLITGRVTNWTRFNRSGRLIVPVAVPFTSDSRAVERILKEIAEAQPLAVLNPAPVIALTGFGSEVMNFEIRIILRDIYQQVQVRSEINHEIARRFRDEGILFSNAHRDHLKRLADEAAALAEAEAEAAGNQAAVAALLDPPASPRRPQGRPPRPRKESKP